MTNIFIIHVAHVQTLNEHCVRIKYCMVRIFQECRCDTVSQACEFLETLKYSSHHYETPKSTEIVKIAILSGFSDF